MELSPVRIVKNPDGSLQQAAMMRQALQKERREEKQQERQNQLSTERATAHERMGKEWQDPMAATSNLFSSTLNSIVTVFVYASTFSCRFSANMS